MQAGCLRYAQDPPRRGEWLNCYHSRMVATLTFSWPSVRLRPPLWAACGIG